MDAAGLAPACKQIESDLGRDRGREIPWGPRTIDIDIVALGNGLAMAPPGGKLDRRPFVLVPLAAIAPDIVIAGHTVADHARAAGSAGVKRLDWPVPQPP
jgi:2-amino-4-hydroxy-6-hydroxymethyldihydropteridine diphosphokinase